MTYFEIIELLNNSEAELKVDTNRNVWRDGKVIARLKRNKKVEEKEKENNKINKIQFGRIEL